MSNYFFKKFIKSKRKKIVSRCLGANGAAISMNSLMYLPDVACSYDVGLCHFHLHFLANITNISQYWRFFSSLLPGSRCTISIQFFFFFSWNVLDIVDDDNASHRARSHSHWSGSDFYLLSNFISSPFFCKFSCLILLSVKVFNVIFIVVVTGAAAFFSIL